LSFGSRIFQGHILFLFAHLYFSIPNWILDQGHFKVMSFFLFAHLYLSIPHWILDQGYFKVVSFNVLFIHSSLLKHSSLNFGSRTFQGHVLFYLLISTYAFPIEFWIKDISRSCPSIFFLFTHLYLNIPHWILDQGHFKVMTFFICSSLNIPHWVLDQSYFRVMSFFYLPIST